MAACAASAQAEPAKAHHQTGHGGALATETATGNPLEPPVEVKADSSLGPGAEAWGNVRRHS
jgi:hypothetical protein